jgi:ribosomal protein S18 acetylase RimI-like enzyme
MNGEFFGSLRIKKPLFAERQAALLLALAHLEPAQRERCIAAGTAAQHALADDLWCAYRGEHLAAAMLAQIEPGHMALVSPPQVARGQPRETADHLLAAMMDHLAGAGVKLARALLVTDHGPDAEVLIASGFRHIAELLYLVSVSGAFPTERPHDPLDFVSYSDAEHKRLADIVARTYEGSLDCPTVEDTRGIDDVLAGYRGAGPFDPVRWFIVRSDGADVGCLLLGQVEEDQQWELVYMGVAPEARGRDFGVAIARYAQWRTAQAGRARLVLGVDAGNAPAIAAYAAAGFVSWDHRSVFLRVF